MNDKIDYDVLKQSYDFTLSDEGELYGLVAGDHYFEPTGIFISKDTLEIWKAGIEAIDKKEDNEG